MYIYVIHGFKKLDRLQPITGFITSQLLALARPPNLSSLVCCSCYSK